MHISFRIDNILISKNCTIKQDWYISFHIIHRYLFTLSNNTSLLEKSRRISNISFDIEEILLSHSSSTTDTIHFDEVKYKIIARTNLPGILITSLLPIRCHLLLSDIMDLWTFLWKELHYLPWISQSSSKGRFYGNNELSLASGCGIEVNFWLNQSITYYFISYCCKGCRCKL